MAQNTSHGAEQRESQRSTPGTLAVVGDVQATGTAAWAARCSGRAVRVAVDDPGEPIIRITTAIAPPPGSADRAGGSVLHDPAPRADHWIVVTRSGELERVLAAHAEQMQGADILLAPGGFGGAIRAAAWFTGNGLTPPRIAETTGFPAMGVHEGDQYAIRAVKRRLPLAAADPATTAELLDSFRSWLPDLVGSDLATTSLGNTNHLIHPPLVITNGVRVARQQKFAFYRDGIADGVDALLTAVDAERRTLLRALGGDTRSGNDWLLRFYGDQGMSGETIVQSLRSFAAFATTPSPPGLDYRYLTDDVPYGIAAWAALAERAGTPHHQLTSLQTIAAALLGRSLDPPAGLVDAVADLVLADAPLDPALEPSAR